MVFQEYNVSYLKKDEDITELTKKIIVPARIIISDRDKK
jgi:hypothetical protein